MGWLVSEDRVIAALEIAATRSDRRRGLMGRSGFDGALLLPKVRAVHTFGMRFPIDVAFVIADESPEAFTVVAVKEMVPHRLGLPVLKADAVIEATAGAFERWGVGVGDRLEVR